MEVTIILSELVEEQTLLMFLMEKDSSLMHDLQLVLKFHAKKFIARITSK
jgi:hypothetical protein